MSEIRFATCSWKYDSWKGLVYPDREKFNFLEEYAKCYSSVEIDQWFWSLFDKVALPRKETAKEYALSVPDDFLFTIKVPNSLTLTHYYKVDKVNPHFLSNDLFDEFLSCIEPMLPKIGSLMFQFEYMNKQKMPSISEFMEKFRKFHEGIPADSPPVSIEIRNPNFLTENWFRFLSDLGISHVFLEGYYMLPIREIYSKYCKYISNYSIIRLHGPDRSGIEELSGGDWSKIYINRDKDLEMIAEMIKDIRKKSSILFVNVNNHYEGSAPVTISKIKNLLG